jgi:G6PDH family F420-dependent oxidoreductase
MERLRECVDVMRALWAGEEVTHRGHVLVDRARLWSLPDEPPLLVAGAVSETTARWAAGWADGLITVNQAPETLRRIAAAYRDAGGRGGLRLQVHLSYAADDDAALAIAYEQWRSNCVPTVLAWDLETPGQFEAATRHVPSAAVAENVRVSSDLGRHAAWLREYLELGFDELYLHHVGREQDDFIDAFGAEVLPRVRAA